MKFCVCIKQVPDVTAPIQLRGGELVYDAGRMVLNAYDASAVEAALVLVEQLGGEIEVVTVGEEPGREVLRKALAMGADKGTFIQTDSASGYDSFTYARVLAAYFKESSFDFILCGKQAQDTDAGLTGGMLAGLLGIPYVTNAVALTMEGDRLVVTRQGDTGQEIIELAAPALVTCSNDMNDPRIPNVKGIMAAKKKPVDTRTVSPAEVGAVATCVVGFEPLPDREAGKLLQGSPEEIIPLLMGLLKTEARVI